jgi:chromosome partitioning protein
MDNSKRGVIASSLSLSGGQGKTLTTYVLGLRVSTLEMPTLLVDSDPQKNLTDLLGVEIPPRHPTLLEVLKGDVSIEDAVYPVPERENLFLVPADRALVNAQYYLASLSNSAYVLSKRLEPVLQDFKLVIIDTPPQKSHLVLTAIGASDVVVIPSEVAAKGIASLTETLALLDECRDMRAFEGELLGVLPFRARWVGLRPTTDTRNNLDAMQEIVGDKLLPPLIESEVYKKAINYGRLPSELGEANADLEYPFEVFLERLRRFLPQIPGRTFHQEKVAV